MSTLHWDSRNAWGLMPPRTVQLWNIYAAMVNRDGVAWPSLSNLRQAMRLKDNGAAMHARRWLIEHDALEIVRGYTPPAERGGSITEHDQRMFLRITGIVTIDGVVYTLLYAPGDEAGADVWRSGNNPTLVGNFPPPLSENSHPPLWENSHPNVVPIEDGRERDARAPELPDHLSPTQRRSLEQDTPGPVTNGDGGALAYSLIEAYCDAWDVSAQKYRDQWHRAQKRGAEQLAAQGATPDQVRAMVAERRAKGKAPDQCSMKWLADDFFGWQERAAMTVQPVPVMTAEKKAERDAAREARMRADWKEKGLV